jgi:hypothetical protein
VVFECELRVARIFAIFRFLHFFFIYLFFYSLPLDVPLLAGFGFKVLSRSANELIIITIIFTVTQKKKMFGKKNKKREFCFATFLETKNQVEKSNKFIHTEKHDELVVQLCTFCTACMSIYVWNKKRLEFIQEKEKKKKKKVK